MIEYADCIKFSATILIFPPFPPQALAVISLLFKITNLGSIKISPPFPSPPFTLVVTLESKRYILSIVFNVIAPPPPSKASVVK